MKHTPYTTYFTSFYTSVCAPPPNITVPWVRGIRASGDEATRQIALLKQIFPSEGSRQIFLTEGWHRVAVLRAKAKSTTRRQSEQKWVGNREGCTERSCKDEGKDRSAGKEFILSCVSEVLHSTAGRGYLRVGNWSPTDLWFSGDRKWFRKECSHFLPQISKYVRLKLDEELT